MNRSVLSLIFVSFSLVHSLECFKNNQKLYDLFHLTDVEIQLLLSGYPGIHVYCLSKIPINKKNHKKKLSLSDELLIEKKENSSKDEASLEQNNLAKTVLAALVEPGDLDMYE